MDRGYRSPLLDIMDSPAPGTHSVAPPPAPVYGSNPFDDLGKVTPVPASSVNTAQTPAASHSNLLLDINDKPAERAKPPPVPNAPKPKMPKRRAKSREPAPRPAGETPSATSSTATPAHNQTASGASSEPAAAHLPELKQLRDPTPEEADKLVSAAAKGDIGTVIKMIIEVRPDALDSHGKTPLIAAIEANNFESFITILPCGTLANLRPPASASSTKPSRDP